jgi:TP901 family phage tail tape measure protein
MNVGTLTIFLGVTTSGINKAIRDVNRLERTVAGSAQSMNAAMLAFGRTMTQFVTFPLSIFGGVATKTFSDFEAELAKVTGLVNIATEQTAAWGEEIKALSPAVAKGPKELAEALYFVTTGGIRGAETMDVLAVSAKAAAAGLGETKDVADIVVSAMNAYGKENLSAAHAADILIASVREGKAEASELARSMGIVLPVASKLGAGFDQVGGAMAAMTRTGTKAGTAAMQVRQILNKIIKPAKQSEDAIREMGSSFGELRHIVATEGIIPMLMKVNELTKEYGVEAVAKLFPRIRALVGVLDILGENLGNNIKAQEAITNSAGALNHAFNTIAKTFQFKVNQLVSQTKSLFIELGEAIGMRLIPIINNLLEVVRKWTESFAALNLTTQDTIVKMSLLAVAMGPAIIAFNIISKTLIAPLVAGFYTLQDALKKVAIGYSAASAGSGAFIVSSTKVVHGLKAITASMAAWMGTNPVGAIMLLVGAIATLLLGINKWRKANEELTLTQRSLNEAREEAQRIFTNEQRVLDSLLKTAKNEYTTKDMRAQAVRRLNELSPAYLRNLTEENVRTEKGTELVNKYIKSLERKAEAEALSNQMTKLAEKRIDDLTTGMDRHLSTMEILWANYQGLIKTVWIWQTKSNIAAELRARQDNKAKEALQEYMDAMDAVEGKYKKTKFSLEEIKTQYGLISDEIKGAKGNDEMYAKSVINNIKEQIKYGKEYIAYLKETTKAQTLSFAFPLIKESNLPKAIGGKGWIYEFFQLDQASADLKTVEEYVNSLEGFMKHVKRVLDNIIGSDKWKERQKRINQLKQEYESTKLTLDLRKLILETQQSYNDKLDEAVDTATESNDIYEKQYGYQDNIKNKLEEIERGLAIMSLHEDMPWLVEKQDLIGVEKLAEWIKFLEKEGLTMLSIYKELKILLEGIKVGEDITDLEMTKEEAELLDDVWDSLRIQTSLYEKQLNAFLRIPLSERTEEWAKSVKELVNKIKELEEIENISRMMTDLSFAMGEVFVDAASGIRNSIDIIMKAMRDYIAEALKAAFATLLLKGTTKGLFGLIGAAVAMGALMSLWNKAKSDAKSASSAAKMAEGGVVPQGYPNDSYPAMLSSGETIMPPKKLPELENRSSDIHLHGEWVNKGRDMYFVVKEEERVRRNAY